MGLESRSIVRWMQIAVAAVITLAIAVGTVWFGFPETLARWGIDAERRLARLGIAQAVVGEWTWTYLDSAAGGGVSAGEPVVLVHGFGGDKDNWTRMAKYLTQQWRVVAVDLPGFGQTTRIRGAGYDTAAQVERLHAFLHDRGLVPAHLAGNSMGGQIVAAYAARYPADVLSLALFANAGISSPTPSAMAQHIAEHGSVPLIVRSRAEFDALMPWLFVNMPNVPGPVYDVLAQRAVAQADFLAEVWADRQARPLPLEPLLPTITTPTLVVWGLQDRLLHPSAVEVMQAQMPGLISIVYLKDVGHVPMLEVPHKSAQIYAAFLHHRAAAAAAAATATTTLAGPGVAAALPEATATTAP